jgi:hypothetical protein
MPVSARISSADCSTNVKILRNSPTGCKQNQRRKSMFSHFEKVVPRKNVRRRLELRITAHDVAYNDGRFDGRFAVVFVLRFYDTVNT